MRALHSCLLVCRPRAALMLCIRRILQGGAYVSTYAHSPQACEIQRRRCTAYLTAEGRAYNQREHNPTQSNTTEHNRPRAKYSIQRVAIVCAHHRSQPYTNCSRAGAVEPTHRPRRIPINAGKVCTHPVRYTGYPRRIAQGGVGICARLVYCVWHRERRGRTPAA
jgi:hypothetical protein